MGSTERPEIPLSRQQRRLIGHSVAGTPGSSLNVMALRDQAAELRLEDLQRCAGLLLRRYPALRLSIEPAGDRYRQILLDEADAASALSVVVRTIPEGGGAVALRAEAAIPVPFDGRPLWRLRCFNAAGRSTLMFVASHALLDGQSLEIVVADLEALLQGEDRDVAPALSFIDYCREAATRPDLERCEAFWRDLLTNSWSAPPLTSPVPGGPPRPERVRYGAGPIDPVTFERASSQLKVSPFAIHLALSLLTLCNLYGTTEMSVMFFSGGRKDLRLRRAVGCFYDPVFLPVRVDPGETLNGFVQRVASQMRAAIDHVEFDISQIMKLLSAEQRKEQGRMPLTTFSVNQAMSFYRALMPGVHNHVGMEFVYDLMLILFESRAHGGLGLVIDYRSDMFAEEDLTTIAAEYFRLAGHVDQPAVPLSSLLKPHSLLDRDRFERRG